MPLNLFRLNQKIESLEDLLKDLDKKTTEQFFLLNNAIIS